MPFERWLHVLRMRLRSLLRGGRLDAEVQEELENHLAHLIERGTAAGIPPATARQAALRAIGGLTQRRTALRSE